MQCHINDTISTIKLRLSNQKGTPVSLLRMSWNGRPLDDDSSIRKLGMANDAIIRAFSVVSYLDACAAVDMLLQKKNREISEIPSFLEKVKHERGVWAIVHVFTSVCVCVMFL